MRTLTLVRTTATADQESPYASSTFAGLSFWLVPTLIEEDTILQEEMDSLRNANKSISSAPFPPHGTLIAGIKEDKGWDAKKTWDAFQEGFSEWREVESKRGPIVCSLEEVTTREMYFQCILLALERNSSLLSLNAQMRKTFSLQDQPPFFPHCSLLYAPLSSEEAERQIADMQRKGVFTSSTESHHISFGSGLTKMTSVTLGAIELWDSNGPVECWKKLERVEL